MTSGSPSSQVSFTCPHCQKPIFIPVGLASTTAPCPHCGIAVRSPDQNIGNIPPAQAANLGSAAMPVAGVAQQQQQQQQQVPVAPVQDAPISLKNTEERNPVPAAATARPIASKEAQLISEQPPAQKGKLGLIVVAILLLTLAGGAAFWLAAKRDKEDRSPAGNVTGGGSSPSDFGASGLDDSWKKEASQVLNGFLTAATPEEKMKYCISNEGVLDELKTFYPAGTEMDASLAAFSHTEGNKIDHDRGIFLMRYRRPAQIDIRNYFAPIGNLETIMGQVEPSLIEMAHRVDEENLAQPIMISAFFKKTGEDLKLDASIFIQSHHRSYKSFIEYPQPGESRVFRVLVMEVLTHQVRDETARRAYQFADFSYQQDYVNLPIAVDSDIGKTLSVLNWRGGNTRGVRRTATIEMAWTDTSPSRLELKNILCWEFLGVGGELGNTAPKAAVDPSATSATSTKVGN